MKVLPSHIAENAATRAASTRASGSDKKAFKSALETAEITLRKGEEMQAVEGHAYAEITSGARAGMYINTSGNVRHGQTFQLVHKDGKEYDISGQWHIPARDIVVWGTLPLESATPERLRRNAPGALWVGGTGQPVWVADSGLQPFEIYADVNETQDVPT